MSNGISGDMTESTTATSYLTGATAVANATTEEATPEVTMAPVEHWSMEKSQSVAALTVLGLEAGVAILSNALLIITIRYSPSLRTPPNSQLLNICVNNLLLVVNIVLALVSMCMSGPPEPSPAAAVSAVVSPTSARGGRNVGVDVLGSMQLFLTATSWLQYWCIFSAIGFYRCTTLRRPSMSNRTRKSIIYRSIWVGWLLSAAAGLTLTLTFRDSSTAVNWNPFRRYVIFKGLQPLLFQQNLVLFLLFVGFLAGLIILSCSYYRIFRMLYVSRPLSQNRVFPLTRTASISSDDKDINLAVRRNYQPSVDGAPQTTPFTIYHAGASSNSIGLSSVGCDSVLGGESNFTVHFQKRHQSVSMDIIALENPLRFLSIQQQNPKQHSQPQRSKPQHAHCKRQVIRPTVSNSSNDSRRTSFPDFTDISPAGELQRSQQFKTSCALRNMAIRRDRISLGGATKNSLVMLLAYFLFSFPMVICSIPGVLHGDSAGQINQPLMACKFIFFMNSPAYPIWYLIFSRRVRKCLGRLVCQIKLWFPGQS